MLTGQRIHRSKRPQVKTATRQKRSWVKASTGQSVDRTENWQLSISELIDPDQGMMIKYRIVKKIIHLHIEMNSLSIIFTVDTFEERSWKKRALLIIVTNFYVSEKGCAKSTSQFRVLDLKDYSSIWHGEWLIENMLLQLFVSQYRIFRKKVEFPRAGRCTIITW